MNLIDLFKNYQIVQNYDELRWLTDKVKATFPITILEVGIEKGGTKFGRNHIPIGASTIVTAICVK